MEKEIIASFDSVYQMVLWILAHPEYSDSDKYPTKVVVKHATSEFYIMKPKNKKGKTK